MQTALLEKYGQILFRGRAISFKNLHLEDGKEPQYFQTKMSILIFSHGYRHVETHLHSIKVKKATNFYCYYFFKISTELVLWEKYIYIKFINIYCKLISVSINKELSFLYAGIYIYGFISQRALYRYTGTHTAEVFILYIWKSSLLQRGCFSQAKNEYLVIFF